jgi:hypothetical protein
MDPEYVIFMCGYIDTCTLTARMLNTKAFVDLDPEHVI